MKFRFKYIPQFSLFFVIAFTLAGCTAPIIQYAKNGQYLNLQKEIDEGADVNAKDLLGETALMKAAEYHPQAIAPLLAAGADVHATNLLGRTALMNAKTEAIPELLAAGADVNAKGYIDETALILAASHNPKSIAPLVAAGADINAQTIGGGTALIRAATYNYKSIAPLLKAGADVFYKDKKGMNALMTILRPKRRYNRGYDYYPSFLSLLAAGGDINAQDNKGRTALMLAIKYRAKAVQPLIDADANVNTRKRSGWTALMYAAEYNPNSIPLLISAGADVNTRTNDGWTALMYAARYNTKAIRNLLEAGAKTEPESNKKTKKFPSGSTALDIAKLTENQQRIEVITVYIEENKAWKFAQKQNNYKDYLASYPHGKHVQQAIDNIERLKNVAILIAQLKSKQTCNLNEENWFYTSNACQEGLAHGVGSATNGKGLFFKGEFRNGARVKGGLYLENELMYKGFIENSRPHGDGICMFKGKTEPCTYSHGERVDTPYKERLEQKRLAFEAQNAKEDTGSLEYFIKYTSHKAVDMLIKEAFNNLF